MDPVSTRRVCLGIAGGLAGPVRDVAEVGVHAAAASWRTPLAAPVRRPTRAVARAAERRGARIESRLLADDSVERLLAHVIDLPSVGRLIERAVATRAPRSPVDQLPADGELDPVVRRLAPREGRFVEPHTRMTLPRVASAASPTPDAGRSTC